MAGQASHNSCCTRSPGVFIPFADPSPSNRSSHVCRYVRVRNLPTTNITSHTPVHLWPVTQLARLASMRRYRLRASPNVHRLSNGVRTQCNARSGRLAHGKRIHSRNLVITFDSLLSPSPGKLFQEGPLCSVLLVSQPLRSTFRRAVIQVRAGQPYSEALQGGLPRPHGCCRLVFRQCVYSHCGAQPALVFWFLGFVPLHRSSLPSSGAGSAAIASIVSHHH